MKVKRYFTLSILTKITFVFFCVLLVRVHFMTGQNSTVLLDSTQSIGAIQSALSQGANVNVRNADGFSALMLAAQRGDFERAKLLLDRGADINFASKKTNVTALHLAAGNAGQQGSLKLVPLLLTRGAHVHAQDILGETPLHKAVNVRGNYASRKKVFSMLVKNGGNINVQNKNGSTPLHLLIVIRDRQGIQDLIPAFGQLFNLRIKNKQKFNPIELALNLGNTEIADLLKQPIRPLGTTGNQINEYNEIGLNGLMLAVIANNESLAQQLLARGADVDLQSKDEYSYSPLQFALLQRHPKMVEFLLKNQANPSLKNAAGDTAMHTVARLHDLKIQKKELQLLAKYNANFNAQDNQGGSILHLIVRLNNKPLLAYLVKNFKKRLNVGLQNLDYDTPLRLAKKLNRKSLIPLLEKLR